MPLRRPAPGGEHLVPLPHALWVLALLAWPAALGCSDGPKLYHVSGKVTFKGQPVPQGKIYFTPDPTKGNQGAQGYADIKDGTYDTAAKGGQGTSGGPMTIHIDANDGVKGANGLFTALFFYDSTVELPQKKSTMDFDVPASAGKKVPKDTGPPP